MSDKGQIANLADFIMAEVPGEPSRSEGAGDAAIRIMREQQQIIRELEQTMIELKPNPVLVEGSWFEVDDLPTILGNFIQSSAEYARDAKDAWIQVESLREQLAARDAVIERVRKHLEVTGYHPLKDALFNALDAAPVSVLAEVKARSWDEGLIAGHKQTGAQYPNANGNPYRKGAGQ